MKNKYNNQLKIHKNSSQISILVQDKPVRL